jgi:hypothetical protein
MRRSRFDSAPVRREDKPAITPFLSPSDVGKLRPVGLYGARRVRGGASWLHV